MNEEERSQLDRFKTLTRWMYEDGKQALFPPAMATFVVLTALFDCIEMCGMFLIGPTDSTGKATSSTARFNTFFDYLGREYKTLRQNNPTINFYNELRCGLSHEGLIKNRQFCILGAHQRFDDETLRNSLIPNHILMGADYRKPVKCGVIFNGSWVVMVGKLLVDFQDAVQKFVNGIENESESRVNFFSAANYINLKNFIIK